MQKKQFLPITLLAILLLSCGNFTEVTGADNIIHSAALSDCGGFDDTKVDVELSEYCDAQIIRWNYDAGTKVFTFSDNRVFLNCCGDHNMTIELEDDIYVITEIDAPANGDRCSCMCSFDYEIEIQNMPAEIIELRLALDVTDSIDTSNDKVWEGSIDLTTTTSGEIVIDDIPIEYGCMN